MHRRRSVFLEIFRYLEPFLFLFIIITHLSELLNAFIRDVLRHEAFATFMYITKTKCWLLFSNHNCLLVIRNVKAYFPVLLFTYITTMNFPSMHQSC